MTRFLTRTVAVAALSAMLVAPFAATAQTVGMTTAVRNTVDVRQVVGGEAKPAVIKQRVSLGNQVDTGSKSSMQVTLLDTSTFTVGPNAKFTVNRFVYDPARQRSSVGSTVAKGTFRMLSGKAARGGANSISTPAATIGIRGTMVEGSVGVDAIAMAASQSGFAGVAGMDPATATMIVLRGPGPKAQGGEKPGEIEVTAGGKSVILTSPGMAVFIPYAGAPPMGPFPLSPSGYSFFDAVLRTAPSSFAGTLAALQDLAPTTPLAMASAASGSAGRGSEAGGGGAETAMAGAGGAGSSLTLGLLGVAGLITGLIAALGDDAPSSP